MVSDTRGHVSTVNVEEHSGNEPLVRLLEDVELLEGVDGVAGDGARALGRVGGACWGGKGEPTARGTMS